MRYTSDEQTAMIDFGVWLTDNKFHRNPITKLWYSDIHSNEFCFDEKSLMEVYCDNPFRLKNHVNKIENDLKNTKPFKPLMVNKLIYPLFDYPPYYKDGKPFTGKMKSTYKVGEVVYIKPENRIGVVLGIIDEVGGELRTDSSGMVSYCDIEFYNPKIHCDAIAHTSLKSALKLFDVD